MSSWGAKRKRKGSYKKGPRKRRRTGYSTALARTGGFLPAGARPAFELKFADFTSAGFTPPGTGVTRFDFPEIKQGAAENQRIGRRITVKRIAVRFAYELVNAVNSSATHETMRYILFIDTQNNSPVAVPDLVSTLLTGDNIYDYRDLSNAKRFYVLKDDLCDMNALAGGIGADTASKLSAKVRKTKEFYIKKDIVLQYAGGTADGGLTQLTENAIYMIWLPDEGARVEVHDLHVRVRFVDA